MHGTRTGSGRVPLIASPRIHGLHPAQCRWTSDNGRYTEADCGARLDSIAPSPAPLPALELQHRLIEVLTSDNCRTIRSLGQPIQPIQYFTDLRLVNNIVGRFWINARTIAPNPGFIDAVDQQ